MIGHATGTNVKCSVSSPSVVPSSTSRCRIRTDSLDSLGDDEHEVDEASDSAMDTEGCVCGCVDVCVLVAAWSPRD